MNKNKLSIINAGRNRWTVVYGGDITTGLKPFIKCLDTNVINYLGDFERKRDAKQWIDNNFPINKNESLIWAVNFKNINQSKPIRVL